MREQCQRFALILAITGSVGGLEQRFRKGALPAGHRMQAGADSLPHPNTVPERLAVAGPVDRPERSNAEPQSQPDPCAEPDTYTRGGTQQVTLELA